LVDLHSIALDADSSRVGHSPICQFSCPDSRPIESGTRQSLGGKSYHRA
jgi:hypothetical protein